MSFSRQFRGDVRYGRLSCVATMLKKLKTPPDAEAKLSLQGALCTAVSKNNVAMLELLLTAVANSDLQRKLELLYKLSVFSNQLEVSEFLSDLRINDKDIAPFLPPVLASLCVSYLKPK